MTPKSYLDLIHLYTSLLSSKRQEMALARDRLLNGLSKLQETNVVVDKMQRELNELQPVLAAKTADTQTLLVQVRQSGWRYAHEYVLLTPAIHTVTTRVDPRPYITLSQLPCSHA